MSDQNAKRTVIGPDTVVSGEIHSKQDLVIQGRVEGTLGVDAVLFIEADGLVEGDVAATHVVVAGTFKGNLEVEDALEVAETGRVMGQVKAPRMLVADGAIMNAELRMSGAAVAPPETAAVTPAEAEDTKSTRRSVYSYTLPATQQAPAPVEPVEDDLAEDEAPAVEVVEAATQQAKKGGKKKKS